MTTRDSMASSMYSQKQHMMPEQGMLFTEGASANPYITPPDSTILDIREKREREIEEREAKKHLKIWEKGTRANRAGKLREISDIESSAPQDEGEQRFTVADAANAALVRDRVHTKENMTKVIEKKREMFLLQMMIDIKKEEIKKLEEYELVREDGLRASENMLIDDMTEFNKYWDESKKKSHEAIKEADEANKTKIKKNAEIKSLNDSIQQIFAQNQKNKDSLDDCAKYKEFMDRITPKEFLERNKNKAEGEEEDKYFTDPAQILEIFSNLIEENLMFIQNIQEQEQSIEESKKQFERAQAELDKKVNVLTESKVTMSKQITEKQAKTQVLEEKLAEETSDTFVEPGTFALLEERIRGIYVMLMGQEEMHAPPIRMLKAIEGKFIGYLEQFEEIELASEDNAKWIHSAVNQREVARKKARVERKQAEQEQFVLERAAKYAARGQDNAKGKVYGKPLMKKCRIPEKQKKVVEKYVDPEEQFMKEFLHG